MSDLISVSSLLKNSAQIEFANTDGTVDMYINVKAVKLEQQYNSIDAVEVVRCVECKHYTNYENYTYKKLGFWWCNKFSNITKPDDFCSYGERKEASE